MQEKITIFFNSMQTNDYVFIFFSIFFAVLFFFLWVEKLYKSYLWLIIGLFVFSFINLMLFSINSSDIWTWNSVKDFFVEHRSFFWYYSVFLIILFAFLIPLNESITFRVSHNYFVQKISVFFLWIFLFTFFLTIFLSIFNNKFLFSIDPIIIEQIKNNLLLSKIIQFFQTSIFFPFLNKYDFIINLIIILYIFYKMTIWWIVDYIFYKIFNFLKNFFEKRASWWKDEYDWWDDDWDDSHH